MCTNTHAFVSAVAFNFFETEALGYLFDACELTPMPPYLQRVSMFLKVEHWNIYLMHVQ